MDLINYTLFLFEDEMLSAKLEGPRIAFGTIVSRKGNGSCLNNKANENFQSSDEKFNSERKTVAFSDVKYKVNSWITYQSDKN